MIIELHIIQNFAPSNLNRDDTNNPKDCEFGGVRRARISSQCLKRATRLAPVFAETTRVEPATRSRWITRKLIAALQEAGKPTEDATNVVTAFGKAYAGKMDSKNPQRTSVLLYLGAGEIRLITQKLLESWEIYHEECLKEKTPQLDALVKELIKETSNHTSAPDIALFGRMLADKPELSLDAACQVAHAISTHRVTMEMDFFTAVDDLQQDEETGAGMMGFTGFNSACFYRYACMDWGQLQANLDDVALARRTVEGFLRASITAVPTGKQNSSAAQNPPSFLLGVVRQDGHAWSLANAFEKPVRPGRDAGLVAPSVQALDIYWDRLQKVYGATGLLAVSALVLEPDLSLESLRSAQAENLDAWMETLLRVLPQE